MFVSLAGPHAPSLIVYATAECVLGILIILILSVRAAYHILQSYQKC